MSKVGLSLVAAFALCMSMAVAQDTSAQGSSGSSSTSQGTTESSPSMSQGSSSSSSSAGMQGGEMKSDKSMKGGKEKTLKGCVKSEGGQYMLEEAHGKMVNLSGSDVAAHVGHEVKVHGMYASGSMGASESSSGGSMSSGKTFNVTSVDMVSESCKMSSKGKDKMSGGSSSGSSTQPPQ